MALRRGHIFTLIFLGAAAWIIPAIDLQWSLHVGSHQWGLGGFGMETFGSLMGESTQDPHPLTFLPFPKDLSGASPFYTGLFVDSWPIWCHDRHSSKRDCVKFLFSELPGSPSLQQ